jgi:uncharacterized protein (TIGR02145 family)
VTLSSILFLFSSCSKLDYSDGEAINGKSTAVFSNTVSYGTVTDADGNIYKTVKIGNQTWMAENLRTTQYNDSTSISNIKDEDAWASLSYGAYCNYNNTKSLDSIATFGRLYNWYAVNSEILAPEGWHVATDEDWQELSDYAGGNSIAGAILKEAGLSHWLTPNTDALNSSGFTAVPAGIRSNTGIFSNTGSYCYFWSSDYYNTMYANRWVLSYNNAELSVSSLHKKFGFSVRCVKD